MWEGLGGLGFQRDPAVCLCSEYCAIDGNLGLPYLIL